MTGLDWNCAGASQETARIARDFQSWEEGKGSPKGIRGNEGLLTLDLRLLASNSEAINFCCFKSPNLCFLAIDVGN